MDLPQRTTPALTFSTSFPEGSALAGTIASFATLASGTIVRPHAGIITGHLGDRIGRKALLVQTEASHSALASFTTLSTGRKWTVRNSRSS